MASTSSYPGAFDSFVNPMSSDPMNSTTVAHAALHTHLADAIAAIETTLGKNPQGGTANISARLDSASYQGHKHAIADINGLQAALDGKAASQHTHAPTDVTSVTGSGTLRDDLAARPLLATTAPVVMAPTASTGTATTAARADHVHPFPKLSEVGAAASSVQIQTGSGLQGGGPLTGNVQLSANLTDGSNSDNGVANTVARGDHVHDSRYYTEAESDARFSNINHNHDDRYVQVIAWSSSNPMLPSTAGVPTGTLLAVTQ